MRLLLLFVFVSSPVSADDVDEVILRYAAENTCTPIRGDIGIRVVSPNRAAVEFQNNDSTKLWGYVAEIFEGRVIVHEWVGCVIGIDLNEDPLYSIDLSPIEVSAYHRLYLKFLVKNDDQWQECFHPIDPATLIHEKMPNVSFKESGVRRIMRVL